VRNDDVGVTLHGDPETVPLCDLGATLDRVDVVAPDGGPIEVWRQLQLQLRRELVLSAHLGVDRVRRISGRTLEPARPLGHHIDLVGSKLVGDAGPVLEVLERLGFDRRVQAGQIADHAVVERELG